MTLTKRLLDPPNKEISHTARNYLGGCIPLAHFKTFMRVEAQSSMAV